MFRNPWETVASRLRRVVITVAASATVALTWSTGPHAQAGCTIAWDGGGGSALWSNRFNWSLERLPVSTDNVCINNTNVVLADFGFHRVRTLTTAGGLTIGSNTFLDILLGGEIGAFLTIQGATITNTGTLTVKGLLTNNNGALNGNGTTEATGEIARTETSSTLEPDSQQLCGCDAHRGIARIRMPGGTFNNRADGTVKLADGVGSDGLGSGTFNNFGTVVKEGNISDFSETAFGLTVNNAGAIISRKGMVRFTAAFTQTTGATSLEGGSMRSTNPLMNFQGGTLTGFGKLTANVQVSGTAIVAPGVNGRDCWRSSAPTRKATPAQH